MNDGQRALLYIGLMAFAVSLFLVLLVAAAVEMVGL